MAGVIAMASVIEDFETQPCKKRKKDSDAPAVKTITNYFTPVAKTVEKPFSPPRTSNIMDYFKKTPPTTKVSSPPQQSKENELQPVEAVVGTDLAAKRSKPLLKKPGRKVGKPAKKALMMNPPGADDDVILVERTAQSENQLGDANIEAAENTVNTASLAQNIGETSGDDKEENSCTDDATATSKKDKIVKKTSESGTPSSRTDPEQDGAGLPVSSTPEEKGRRGRAGRKNGRERKADLVQSDVVPDTKECFEQQLQASSLLCDADLEMDANDESHLNLSTVTVSFEDFLRSHSPKGTKQKEVVEEEKEETEAGETRPTATTFDQAADRLSKASKEDDEPPTQVSPRTLTVKAEVHPISPDQDLSRASDRKVASLFTACRKSKEKSAPSPQPQASSETPPAPLRKSNVVLQEEDLELAVLEAGSSSSTPSVPKCSQAERKQFMNAFKQPGVDTSKGKASKAAGKQKQQQQQLPEKSASADGEKEEEQVEEVKAKGSEVETLEGDPKTLELKDGTQKAARKRKRGRPSKEQRTSPEESTSPATLPAEAETKPAVPATVKVPAVTSKAPTAGEAEEALSGAAQLRRSTRELTRKQITPASLSPSSQSQSKHTESTSKPQELITPISTPKTHHPKRRVYQSHMVVPPDDKGSPIRMKFTRVFTSPGETSEFQILSPLAKEDSKKRKKAQKLLQKAKAFQQNKQAATAEEKAPLRRSSRHQETLKKTYCESEDSVICLERDEDGSNEKADNSKAKNPKQVRSLNDVLGKNAPGTKMTKTPAGAKVAPLFTGKKPQRPSTVISIFDDSSRDASDTSLDDEQFRARREFLKSGLPESFRKQIAKTAATREAYTLSCSSFQKVVHVLQRPDNCSLWSLPWPVCPRLACVKEAGDAGALVSSSPLCVGGPLNLSIVPAQRSHREQCVSGLREDFSEAVQRWLLEEISASNPSFPTQRIFSQMLKRRAEHLLKPSAPNIEGVHQNAAARSSCSQPVGGKRKREEGDATDKVAKKHRSSRKEPETITIPDNTPEPPRRGRGRPRRQQEQKQKEEGEKPTSEVASTPVDCQKDCVIVLDSPSPSEHTSTEDVVREDVMWTEKYQPQHSSEVIGNMQSVRRLHSWLREWKLRADREERKKQQEKKQEGDLNDSWLSECGEEEDLLCNTLLITGPTGVGKTAAVYACAQELGFKVFEVNCSSQRSGRQILSQLKEATQSHQVDIQGVNACKPTFFNSYSSSSGGGGSGSRPGSSPRKVNSPRRVVSSPHKPPQSPRRGHMKRGSLAPTSLANFFKMGAKPPLKESSETNNKKPQPASKSPRKKAKAKEASCSSEDQSATPPATVTLTTPSSAPASLISTPGGKATGEEQGKRTATSLILFEEVDVIFDDDTGFLAAIKTFMTTTKRPVILTTSDPNFRTSFDGYFDEIHFETPSVENVSSYLRLLCLAENVRVSGEDVASLLRCNGGDVRQSLLQLQCWVRSGAGFRVGAPHAGLLATHSAMQSQQLSGDGAAQDQDGKPDIPLCDVGCAASLLGLLSVQPPRNLLEFIKSESATPLCWDLLAEVDRRGFDVLYPNMEALLPLPKRPLKQALLKTLTETAPGQTASAASAPIATDIPPQPANNNTKPLLLAETEDEASPLKVSSRMRRKKQHHPESKDPFQSDSDSEDGFLSLPRPASTLCPASKQLKEDSEDVTMPPLALPETERSKRRVFTEAEKKRSAPVSLALGAMAEFMDHMSALDSCLTCPMWQSAEGVNMTAYDRAQAEIRSGLTDEPRLEGGGGNGVCRWAAGEDQAWEIQAAVKSLSFRRCRAGVEQAWGAAQALEEEDGVRQAALEEITLPVALHRQTFSITPYNALCPPSLLQRRCELMQSVCSSRLVTSTRVATALDVLPALRTICKSEQLKEQGKVKRRFLHYLESINLGLPKQTLQLLAADFP